MSETELGSGLAVRGRAAWIDIGRPEAMNALNEAALGRISDGLEAAAADDLVRVVVIHARGPVFCAGADLKLARRKLAENGGGIGSYLAEIGRTFERVAAHPDPVIAAVGGAAIAGGLELVLACDLVVASEDATFSDGHATYGLFPGAGGAVRLPRIVGENLAKEMLFTGWAYPAERMKGAGLVSSVVPPSALEERVASLCARIAAGSRDGLTRMKRVVAAGRGLRLEDALALERDECTAHLSGPDAAEGLVAFAEGREPRFS